MGKVEAIKEYKLSEMLYSVEIETLMRIVERRKDVHGVKELLQRQRPSDNNTSHKFIIYLKSPGYKRGGQ